MISCNRILRTKWWKFYVKWKVSNALRIRSIHPSALVKCLTSCLRIRHWNICCCKIGDVIDYYQSSTVPSHVEGLQTKLELVSFENEKPSYQTGPNPYRLTSSSASPTGPSDSRTVLVAEVPLSGEQRARAFSPLLKTLKFATRMFLTKK